MSGRPRIITFTNLFPSAARPGHGTFVQDRATRVAARTGFDWEVVCPVPAVPRLLRRRADRWTARVPARESVAGVTVHHPRYRHLPGLSLRAQAARMRDAARPVLAALAAAGPCLVDAHYVYPDGVAALALARELELPCFVTARGSDVNVLGAEPTVVAQLRDVAPAATGWFAVSAPLAEQLAAMLGVATDTVRVARNGVDLERFRPGDRRAARAELGLPAAAAIVCGVGRLVPGKGFHLMARALRELPDAVHFALAGDGPERERLLGIAPPGRLHLLGALPQERVAVLYRAADLLVLPSEREGWPNVVTEALASGLRVVATPVGAVPELLAVPYAGSLVRGGDPRALQREVERLLRSPAEPARVREYASRFSWDGPIEMLAQTFCRAMA
ncbi:MAG: glycosyltransferase [Planctomycetes bacterium]|nr:glycosyltransferase [Planctomycetota bacterium]